MRDMGLMGRKSAYEKTCLVDGKRQKMIRTSDGQKVILVDSSADDETKQKKGCDMDFPQLDDLVLESQEATKVEDTKKTAIKIAFVGAGQGGCKIADEFWAQGYRRILLLNTTDQDMAGLSCPNRLVVGSGNVGAGKNPAIGRSNAEKSREDVLRAFKRHFGHDVELVVICAGAGGGTGSGAAPILVEVAKDFLASINAEGRHVGVIVAFPKKSEGPTVMENAQALMSKLLDMAGEKVVAPLVVIDNEKIGKMFPKASITDFFKIANKNIAGLFNVFNELAVQASPFSTLDPADLRTVMYSGALVFGMTPLSKVDSETAIAEAIQKNAQGGLFSDSFSLKGATHAAAILVAKKEMLAKIPQSHFDMAFETLQRVMGDKGTVLHSGIYEGGDGLGEKVMLYTLVGGLK